ncbi:hypothetical protein M0R89_11520 [Halorussus limi]|uniref:Uncharacterized protein n=1 Tax=Halorussus limi TaxID=2938695 RepID=A0A8U0HR10_9EURY|nr:hypothetical protein [Halorussus limi]UPV73176.1 hypothetical protein M0R89_11520 [Halorussus limi]
MIDRNTADWAESVLGPLYVAGSLASAGLADVVPEYATGWTLMDTVNIGGEPVMWGTVLAAAALVAAWLVQRDSVGEISERGQKVIALDAASIVLVTFVPALGEWVTSNLVPGLAYFLLGVAAYYYISYA